MGSGEPMSEKRLREIRKGIEMGQMDMDEDEAFWAIRDLLADNERLRAREVALVAEREQAMAVVRAVAALSEPRTDARRTWECSLCGAYLIAHEHEDDCIVLKASALLASAGEQAAQDEAPAACPICGTLAERMPDYGSPDKWWCNGCNLPFHKPGAA